MVGIPDDRKYTDRCRVIQEITSTKFLFQHVFGMAYFVSIPTTPFQISLVFILTKNR